jgi:hypothetical protein
MNRSARVCSALLLVLLLFAISGLIGGGDFLFSPSQVYRKQVDSIFAGQLAVSHDPRDLEWDHSWTMDGVQQVWGLGVPAWLLPWTGVSKLMGFEAFPDRIAFGLFACLASYLFLLSVERIARQVLGKRVLVLPLVLGLGVIGFPPMVSMIQMRFAQYEEAVSYSYLFAILQLALLVLLIIRPRRWLWFLLCALAGLGGLIRPTLVFYGGATVLCGALAMLPIWFRKSGRTMKGPGTSLATGIVLFCVGGGLLWLTNFERFGDGFEFGHAVNLQDTTDARYATIFGMPFEDAPVTEAALELFGALFMPKSLNGENYRQTEIYFGQSARIRWREFSFDTYNLGYLFLLLAGWGVSVACVRRKNVPIPGDGSMEDWTTDNEREFTRVCLIVGLWSVIVFVSLFVFYLWVPWSTSRYTLDFGATFVGALLIVVFAVLRRPNSQGFWRVAAAMFVACWCIEVFANDQARSRIEKPYPYHNIAGNRMLPDDKILAMLEKGFTRRGDPPTGIPFDRQGWNQEDGSVKSLFITFVTDAEFLELALRMRDELSNESALHFVRAKLGTEFLVPRSVKKTSTGWKIRFDGPKLKRHQSGLQTVFVATVPKEGFLDQSTPWILDAVRWKE